ncbi:AT-rich interactive domain-containing protein 2 isoform X2 [Toxorhynchites rutilus septentrionalis]|uniref:AT-rich interactive domain-containing protein 2 isoform X2 n=1 Tax=Toxorhynchites rutilus septentrionalis TaxID=329112 RepID=UPI00247A5E4A|nr:AT-rich interactive domain-containing protein 2 isoform X2 [Toxorhynchites rutilus septentrionalis]
MTTDGENKVKIERRNQDEEDALLSQNSCGGTPAKETGGKARSRTKLIFEKDKTSFMQDLQAFHEKYGTPFLHPPRISGHDVDLHRLYSVVIARGGWLKVNSREDWDEVIDDLKLPKRCVNNEIVVKQIYIRYLDKYERVNFHGEEKDPIEEEDDEKRHNRRWSVRMLHSVPAVYNHSQHNVPESMRASSNLSCDLYKPSEYDKLILSLLSPLPNEQDFAINVCTLMSNESKHTLKVDKCAKLIYVLLAHAGVFNHYTLREMFDEYYTHIRKHSLQRFWKNCLLEKPHILELSYEDCFLKMELDPTELIKNIYSEEAEMDDDDCGKLSVASLRSFLSLGTGLGTNDYIGQRIQQIASIFRNLSFNDENMTVLARNNYFLKFLIMCANSRWGNLHHMGLDMLGNVATEIEINDPQTDEVSRCLISTISDGLEGADRGIILSCLEILSKIAQKESNEDNLNRFLNQKNYDQICLFLTLSDIMLLLYTLECIYSLTSIGEKPCNAIMHVTGIIDTLVSLVTVEAQSYGPDACILMRVVETIPGNLAGYYPTNPSSTTASHPPSPNPTLLTLHSKEQPSLPTPNVPMLPEIPKIPVPTKPFVSQSQQLINTQSSIQVTNVAHPAASQSPQIPINIISRNDPNHTPATPPRISSSATPVQLTSASSPVPTGGPITVAAKHAQQQQSQENEQFAYAWLKATFETTASLASKIEQNEVYKLYLAANTKIGRKAVVPPSHFPRCVRTVFGGTVGPTQIRIEQNGTETNNFYYEGINLRAKSVAMNASVENTTGNLTISKQPRSTQQGESKTNLISKTDPSKLNQQTSLDNKPPPKTSLSNSNSNLTTASTKPMQQSKVQPTKPLLHKNPLQLVGGGIGATSLTSGSCKQIITSQVGGKTVQNQQAQILQQVLTSSSGEQKGNIIVVNQTTISPQPLGSVAASPVPSQQTTGTTTIMNQSGTISSTTTNPSALIKSLLANKVTTVTSSSESAAISTTGSIVVPSTSSFSSTTTSNTSINPSTSSTSNCLIASNVNVHQVAQRQQLLKQKQKGTGSAIQLPNSSVVVTSNNPNNLTNIKVGNSTISIKPGTLPTNTVITATNPHENESVQMNPPPLAPLSSQMAGGAIIKPITTNKMLTDLLDKKTHDPQVFAIGETTVKRKSDIDAAEPPTKKLDLMGTEEVKVTPKAADLYAELAGSILEGEELEDVEMKMTKEQPKIIPQAAQATQQQVITMPVPMQRQIIMTPNNPSGMLLSPGGSGGQQLTAQTTATIKTDTGYQTVPVILQHNQSPIQIQKSAPIIQPTVITNSQQPTQYILATNPQGQTYVVAQQPQSQSQLQQTVLLTQNPQHGNQQKTIIILQQQPTQNTVSQIQGQQIVQAQPQTSQKLFVNQQGQQIIMTQVPRQVPHQGNTISIEGPTQQIVKSNQPAAQIMQTQIGQHQHSTSQQIQQIIQQGGSQTIQIIQQPQQQQQVHSQQPQQILIQPQAVSQQQQQQQIVIQSQPTQQLQPHIISQQIIQPATGQQVIQKVIQQKPAPQSTQQQQQVIVHKQPVSVQQSQQSSSAITVTKQSIIVQQPTVTGSPQKQMIQVLQQKIASPQTQSQMMTPTHKTAIQTQAAMMTAVKSQTAVESTAATTITPPVSSSMFTKTTMNVSKPTTSTQSSIAFSSTPVSTIQSITSVASTTSVPTTVQPSSNQASSNAFNSTTTTTTIPVAGSNCSIQMIPAMDPVKVVDEDVELSWPWICDWRGCPRKKFASANEVYMHACAVHCPDTVDSAADIYCQWGPGPNLCDNLPRKRFSLMTHIFDRHCTSESFKSAVQRRLVNVTAGTQQPQQAYPVTLVRQPAATPPGSSASSTASESSSSPSSVQPPIQHGSGQPSNAGPAALHAMKRHAVDWMNAKEFQDDIEGPVTKSIRLTSALILRNLVVYNNTARRNLRAYEPHLAGVAINNVEASRTIAQVLFEMNDTRPNF